MNKEIRFGVILQYCQMGLSILISLIYTPLILRILGSSEYGLYNLASSVISYLSLLSLGFGSSYVRYYFLQKKNNPSKIKNLNGLYLFVFCIIGVVALLCGLIISDNVSIFFNNTYLKSDMSIASTLMIILSINMAVSFPMSLFVNYLTAQQKFICQKLLNMGKTVLSPVLSIIALFLGYGSIGLVITTTFISFIIDLINIYYCFKKLKMEISFKMMDFSLAKDIFVFSIFIAINQIVDQINWQTDKIILAKMISSTAVSIYAIGSIINNNFIQFSSAISSVFAPQVNEITQCDKQDDVKNQMLTSLMIKVGRVQFFILALVFSGFVFFGLYFVEIWAGQEYKLSYFVALLLMAPELFVLIQNLGIEIQRAKNMHKFRSIVYLIMAILNIGLSIILCKAYGIIGVSIGTTISLVIANILIMNIYYYKKIKIDIIKFWHEIFKIIPALTIPISFGVFYLVIFPKNILIFFIGIIVYTFIYFLSCYIFAMNKKEKLYLRRIIKRE